MDLQKLERQTNEIIDYWISEYQRYDWEQVLAKPSEKEWSLGQVGIHLWMSAKGFFFKRAEQCLNGEETVKGKGKNFSGHIIFTLRMFPPAKYEMPSSVAVIPKQPESRELLIARLEEIKVLARDFIKRIPQSDPTQKLRHPFLGYLNTAEWISLCNIHFRHHLRQKKRIEQHFGWEKPA